MAEVTDGRVKASLVAKLALPLALVALIPALLGLRTAGQNTDDVRRATEENERAIRYVCATTAVLDGLVTTAAQTIQTNFQTGSYDRLLRLGVLTATDVEQARTQMRKYMAAHELLIRDDPCQAVRQKGS